jgi:hypothetical protein
LAALPSYGELILNLSGKPNITREMCGMLPRERDVVSFSGGLDVRGTFFLLKMRLKDGREEVLRLPSPLTIHVAKSLRESIRQHKYKDVRRQKGDKKLELGLVRSFLDKQPTLSERDWDFSQDQKPSVVTGCEVHSFSNAVFIGLKVTSDTYRIYRFPPAISFYLAEMIEEADRAGHLLDVSRIQSGSDDLH